MAGGGGGLAYAHVVNERNSDDDLIVAASTATATRFLIFKLVPFISIDIYSTLFMI